jgi:hypothetical protein
MSLIRVYVAKDDIEQLPQFSTFQDGSVSTKSFWAVQLLHL